jgi:4-amino-4-deoxy-L-arabinose transferase-like glycosyltransferase
VRLALAGLLPLTEDEAYYRLWSMRPDFGYFDHPPMIAWWLWLGRHVGGDTPFGVRLAPILATGLTSLVTFDLARLAGLTERAAARAAIWLNATFLIGLGGVLAAPDAPTCLFWTLALWCVFRAGRGAGAWWLAAGLAAGLACLSKYSGLFLAPGILLWKLATPAGRRELATPWPWLASVIAIAVFAPNVAWNATHHWLTFGKQFGRVAATQFEPHYLAEFILDQSLLLNPLITAFLALAVWRRTCWPLLLTSAPFVLYLLVHSLHDQVQGQWPAPLYTSLVICAAAAAEQISPKGLWADTRRRAPYVGFGVSLVVLAFLCAPLDGRLPFRDPAARLRGWPGFAQGIERERVALGAGWVGTGAYGASSQLAAEPAIHAPVIQFLERERYTFETPATRADFGKPGLVIAGWRDATGGVLKGCFANVRSLGEIDRGHGGARSPYALFLVSGAKRDVEKVGC